MRGVKLLADIVLLLLRLIFLSPFLRLIMKSVLHTCPCPHFSLQRKQRLFVLLSAESSEVIFLRLSSVGHFLRWNNWATALFEKKKRVFTVVVPGKIKLGILGKKPTENGCGCHAAHHSEKEKNFHPFLGCPPAFAHSLNTRSIKHFH